MNKQTLIRPDSLESLRVISRLEVGPVRLEKRRIKTPYTIVQSGKTHSTELIYRFEEDVFQPEDPDSANLACLVTAQVAFNYGLFCDEIVFHGPYDILDRRFISRMMANTAREIYVKKFLEPNPFLSGEAASLPLVKMDNYLAARLQFTDTDSFHESPSKRNSREHRLFWKTGHNHHAVLSSGGKDSLLSFGLLKELDKNVHPIFINESGRHWYTALNAYRHFKKTYPETTRVWTNADRVFAWMLRHFPFIRKDFANVRSDEYPIRLWTVAVFLFGALPLLKKRAAARLIIGNEYDTTARLSYQGITHYNGLYDQSRYFDNALTRFFIRKGWNISQFSLLRPLSELLIEKILVERYPDLQRHQMSCHATHIEKDRVFPCGNCEKCRRIVGMLAALDADPNWCGYSKTQIEHCLSELPAKGVHQETSGAQQLAYMLENKKIIPAHSKVFPAHNQPEILKMRFDRERSPEDSIPIDLREAVYQILLKHTDGAVRRQGRMWIDFNPMDKATLAIPFPFEVPSQRRNESPLSFLLEHLTWPEAQLRFNEVDIALLPVGSIEQHGPHLPLDTDAFDSGYLARHVAASCSDPKPFVLPLIPYGVSYHHADFSGTLGISPKTLADLVYEVGMSAARHGITKLVIINGHGGNIPALQFAAQMINCDARIFTCVETGETSEKDILDLTETQNDVHAGEIETSTSLATRPEKVQQDKMRKFIPRFSSRYLNFSSKRSVEWFARISRISPTGVLGDPTQASREKGEQMWNIMIKHLTEFVEDLKKMSLDEIFQKRY
ncbi:MAG: creatininase family protein [Candidatus Aminicenantes bacterium]|jgi:creatinine amidohydrolase/Fe(II)-dependent formamide hydrolase-like protein